MSLKPTPAEEANHIAHDELNPAENPTEEQAHIEHDEEVIAGEGEKQFIKLYEELAKKGLQVSADDFLGIVLTHFQDLQDPINKPIAGLISLVSMEKMGTITPEQEVFLEHYREEISEGFLELMEGTWTPIDRQSIENTQQALALIDTFMEPKEGYEDFAEAIPLMQALEEEEIATALAEEAIEEGDIEGRLEVMYNLVKKDLKGTTRREKKEGKIPKMYEEAMAMAGVKSKKGGEKPTMGRKDDRMSAEEAYNLAGKLK